MIKEDNEVGPGGGPAFPLHHHPYPGMELRDWLAGQAIHNADLCTGAAPDWQLRAWFGENSRGLRREQIAAVQAYELADAMLHARRSTE